MTNVLAQEPLSWYTLLTKLYDKKSVDITFQLTEDCCMACTYCYQHNKTNNKMTFETAKLVIDKIFDNNYLNISNDEYQTLIINFIGGEPLLEVDLIDKIMDYVLSKMIELNHPWLLTFKASICSNGLLYFNPSVQELFKKYSNFLDFNISLDGNKILHDACRIDLNGNGTYDRIVKAIKHYRENYGLLINTKLTLSPDNINYLYEALINLIELNFTEIYVNCIFEEGWNYSHAKILYNELKKIGDYLIQNNLYDKIFIRFFQEDSYCPISEEDNKNWCGGIFENNVRDYFSVNYKGEVYPCIRYMDSSLNGQQKPLIIDNIYNNNYSEEFQNNIQLLSNITRRSQSTDKCFYCPIAAGCAWCSAYNYEKFGTPNKRATYICCMHKSASLANVYFLNKLYQHLNINKKFKMYLPKTEALNIISEKEYNYLLDLSQE